MKVKDHKKYALFNYISEPSDESDKFSLGDIVTKRTTFEGEEEVEIGVVLQVHGRGDYRTDMFGNFSDSEVTMSTIEEIIQFRPKLYSDIEK
jgi:hypothetical protein